MSWIVRALLGGVFILGFAGCGAAPGTPPASPSADGEVRGIDARAEPPARRNGACPPGYIFDGRSCRKQRGIIIDQKEEDKKPRPDPRPSPPPLPPPPPWPSPPPPPPV